MLSHVEPHVYLRAGFGGRVLRISHADRVSGLPLAAPFRPHYLYFLNSGAAHARVVYRAEKSGVGVSSGIDFAL